jgi:hypothetical protein
VQRIESAELPESTSSWLPPETDRSRIRPGRAYINTPRERVRAEVLEYESSLAQLLTDRDTPGWLTQGLAGARARLPDWVDPHALPPVTVAGRRFDGAPGNQQAEGFDDLNRR